jgi:hypothetical protein
MKAEIIQKAIALVFFAALFVLFANLGLFSRFDFLIPLGVLVLIGTVTLFRARPGQSWRVLIVIVALPVFWLLILAWGSVFFVGLREPQNPQWVQYPLAIAPWLYAVLAGLCVWRLPKARILAVTYSLLNLYFVLVCTFVAGMSVTGVWL